MVALQPCYQNLEHAGQYGEMVVKHRDMESNQRVSYARTLLWRVMWRRHSIKPLQQQVEESLGICECFIGYKKSLPKIHIFSVIYEATV
jgi:hypothetical protein